MMTSKIMLILAGLYYAPWVAAAPQLPSVASSSLQASAKASASSSASQSSRTVVSVAITGVQPSAPTVTSKSTQFDSSLVQTSNTTASYDTRTWPFMFPKASASARQQVLENGNSAWEYFGHNDTEPLISTPAITNTTTNQTANATANATATVTLDPSDNSETTSLDLSDFDDGASLEAAPIAGKAVFAHFMVANARTWTEAQWKADILEAKFAKIDGFALNIAYNESVDNAIALAFKASMSYGFKLIFSFDYAGNGAWPKADVQALINNYKNSSAHYLHNGKPLVSTFEGPDNSEDWIDIKKETNCFFMPDWSSRGARFALELSKGVADGLFSWAAWPWGPTDMDTYVDASYLDFLGQAGGKPYMMPVSPTFYTNMPGFDKNWLWRGDDLWRDRWEQVLFVQPQFVQIISWNDYGESHYIGPLHSDGYEAFERGKAPYNYVIDMPHDAWRMLLPYWIDMYKLGKASFINEIVVAWYKPYPGSSTACSWGGTTGNTASQLLIEFPPNQVSQDKIFFSALLSKAASVSVTVGGVAVAATWTDVPFDGVGVHHGSAIIGSLAGAVVVTVSRSGVLVAPKITGKSISTACNNGYGNWNTWVAGSTGPNIATASTTVPVENQVCIQGTAPGNFKGLCEHNCAYGYCPIGACQCLKMGTQKPLPTSTGKKGYPIAGLGSSYIGLCDFACNLGYCPSDACGLVKVPLTEPTVSPFLPPSCRSGTGTGNLAGLCSYSCNYGFCPMQSCKCTSTGALIQPPAQIGKIKAFTTDGTKDNGLCTFACSRGYCPAPCMSDKDEVKPCGVDPANEKEACGSEPSCDFETKYANLDDLAKATMSQYCRTIISLDVLSTMLTNALAEYEIVNKGYDSAFGYYQKFLKNQVPAALAKYMLDVPAGPGNKYFTCNYKSARGTVKSQQCPIDLRELTAQEWTIDYVLNDKDGFEKELAEKYGIIPDWVKFDSDRQTCNEPTCTLNSRWKYHYPQAADNIVVPNPKDVMTNSLAKLDQLQMSLGVTQIEMLMGNWLGRGEDPVQVLSMPIFMMIQAIATMKDVKDIGEDAAEDEKKNLILMIVSAILFVVPFVGEAAAVAAGFANLGRIIALAGIAGNTALTVIDIIKNPDAAPLAILGMLTPGFRTPRDFSRVAAVRRSFDVTEMAKFGSVFKKNDDALQGLLKACKK